MTSAEIAAQARATATPLNDLDAAGQTDRERERSHIAALAAEAGLSDYAAEKFLEKTEAIGSIFRWDNGAHKTPSFATIPQPKLPLERGGESEGGSIVSKDTIAPPPHALPLPHGRKGKKTHG